ncbi:MAG: XRE family transcriptional regulator [Intestinimonas massiliensis]|uniref:XRE family transcriptional regulator n=1 Tax=Intestinimonas massiliensis (ex Afouda et al. 2020) TaxID=1673721 RepID=UPI0024306E6E|nr:XRE family transcriptional regulator [Intestinimonas massiliensis (ex Afouda et al. 2020)]MCI5563836.1 XRE family transcriptional regulator [Intestinimonas massiliensis (ex Afouda et al. 2020)]
MAQFTEFGRNVKKALIDAKQTQAWLSKEVSERTGLVVDDAYMSNILAGRRDSPKIVRAIREILSLPE